MKQLLLITILFSTILFSCQKKDDTTPDIAKTTLTLDSPIEGQTFHTGDTVHIDASVTSPTELHGYEVKITDTATGNILFDQAYHVHDDHFAVHEYWVNSLNKTTVLKFELIAFLDHDGLDATKQVFFTAQP